MKASRRTAAVIAGLLGLFAMQGRARAQVPSTDVLGSFEGTNQSISFTIGVDTAPVDVVAGSISLTTDDPFCIPTSIRVCRYRLNQISFTLQNLTVDVDGAGRFLLEAPFAVIDTPIDVIDAGLGIEVPTGTPVRVGAIVSGPNLPRQLRQSTLGLPEPATVGVRALSDLVTLDGLFPFSFNIEGVVVRGSLHGFASARIPLENTAPFAVASAATTVTCPQTVALSGAGSLDKEHNIQSFTWLIDGQTNLLGPEVAPFLREGSHSIELTVADTLLGIGRDVLTIDVIDPPPRFDSVPSDIVTESCGQLAIGTPVVSSPCGPVSLSNDSPGTFFAGVHRVTWTATSSTGKQSVHVQEIVVLPSDNAACCPPGSNVIVGTSNNDVLTGTEGADCIIGRGAQDQISGRGGNDLISAGDGDDVIDAGSGSDLVSAGSGQDAVSGQGGDDYLAGRDGDDRLFGGDGADRLYGGQGQDQLSGGAGADACFGEAGDDRLFGEVGDDLLNGGENNNQCTGGEGFDTMIQCAPQDTQESAGTPAFPGDPNYAVCTCKSQKCTDCQSAVSACQTTTGCPQILQCVQETAGCNLPHECSALCESGRFPSAIQAARTVASCFGGCN